MASTSCTSLRNLDETRCSAWLTKKRRFCKNRISLKERTQRNNQRDTITDRSSPTDVEEFTDLHFCQSVHRGGKRCAAPQADRDRVVSDLLRRTESASFVLQVTHNIDADPPMPIQSQSDALSVQSRPASLSEPTIVAPSLAASGDTTAGHVDEVQHSAPGQEITAKSVNPAPPVTVTSTGQSLEKPPQPRRSERLAHRRPPIVPFLSGHSSEAGRDPSRHLDTTSRTPVIVEVRPELRHSRRLRGKSPMRDPVEPVDTTVSAPPSCLICREVDVSGKYQGCPSIGEEKCAGTFHVECIAEWLKGASDCPYCRRKTSWDLAPNLYGWT